MDGRNCVEKNEDGDCLKCDKGESYGYCLNRYFGCIFNELPDYGVIKLKNNFTNKLGSSIPEGWNKIIIN